MTAPARASTVASTFSIVAADPASGEVGVAVQSKYLAVGAVVPWVRAGVGAVATQAMAFAGFGPQILGALAKGTAPGQALAAALRDDPLPARRQVGVVSAAGEPVNHTGAECTAWAGGLLGPNFAVQGNILAGEAVVREMARAFETGLGPLCERLLAALQAGQAAGGDKRGEQSAALVVERNGYAQETRLGIDRVIDLRVDDHPHPITELRRLLDLRLRQEVAFRAMRFYLDRDYPRAVAIMADGARQFPDSPEILYDLACFESLAGQAEPCLVHLARALELTPGMRPMAAADADFDLVRASPAFLRLVGGT
jgi:uncharacterized Ntn-hydrolase superfamily protein